MGVSRQLLLRGVLAIASWPLSGLATAEVVFVKYRGLVDLDNPVAPFACEWVRSSLVKRVCYSPKARYMVISLRGTYYHYCDIDKETVRALVSAPSVGREYNAVIKGRFDCRLTHVPDFRPAAR